MTSVTRSKGAHRERRTAAARRILDAAESLLRSGERFTEIPVERLLAEADVSRSTFYVHFADKSALLARLAERALSDVAKSADLWWESDLRSGGIEGLTDAIRGMVKTYRRHAAVLRALGEVSAYDEAISTVRRLRTDEYINLSADRIREEQRAELIDASIDAEFGASVTIRLIDGAILDHVLHGNARDDGRLATTLARIGWLARYGRVGAIDYVRAS